MLRNNYYFITDTLDLLLDRRDSLTPPARQRFFIGPGDFKSIGEEFLNYFIEIAGLKSDSRVLDIGCGIGRMALPLTKYLNAAGGYEGVDIVASAINWCRKNITPKYPNFHFQSADIYNKAFNRRGKHKAADYKFPYADESFDFIFLASVFTHMLPFDMENYFSEIARLLKSSGRCLITFFLINRESLKLIEAKLSEIDFKYATKEYRTTDRNTPESTLAYEEAFIRRLYEHYRLDIVEPIRYGAWCKRSHFLSYQDIIVANKRY